jgi:L-fuculose-phosphate aldolase
MIVEAAGNPGPEFPRADIEQLRRDIGRPDQFVVNFDYLVRRVQQRRK